MLKDSFQKLKRFFLKLNGNPPIQDFARPIGSPYYQYQNILQNPSFINRNNVPNFGMQYQGQNLLENEQFSSPYIQPVQNLQSRQILPANEQYSNVPQFTNQNLQSHQSQPPVEQGIAKGKKLLIKP